MDSSCDFVAFTSKFLFRMTWFFDLKSDVVLFSKYILASIFTYQKNMYHLY